MRIRNIQGLSHKDLKNETNQGGRFIYFAVTVSFIVVSFKRTSGVYLLKSGEKAYRKLLFYSLLTVLFGWWALPNGPRYTLEALRTNIRGGKDVTGEVMDTVEGHILFQEAEAQRKAS